jgi:predicted amidohydrolase
MNGLLGEPERVLAAIDVWCERAAAANADLVLFPELVVHGHCTPKTWELAEPVPEGPSTRRLSDLARRHRLVLSVGLSEKERDIVYNTQMLVGPNVDIGKQRRLDLSRDRLAVSSSGGPILVDGPNTGLLLPG